MRRWSTQNTLPRPRTPTKRHGELEELKPAEAIPLLDKAVRLKPACAEAYMLRGEARKGIGDHARAEGESAGSWNLRIPDALERLDHAQVELAIALTPDFRFGLVFRPRLLERPIVDQRVINIRHGDDPAAQRNLFADQAARISASVPMLVVRQRNFFGLLQDQRVAAGQQFGARVVWVVICANSSADNLPGFSSTLSGMAILPMSCSGAAHRICRISLSESPSSAANAAAASPMPPRMFAGAVVAEFGGPAEPFDEVVLGPYEVFGSELHLKVQR